MSLVTQLIVAIAVIAGLMFVKVTAFRILLGRGPHEAGDVDGCEKQDCLGGCGGRDGNVN